MAIAHVYSLSCTLYVIADQFLMPRYVMFVVSGLVKFTLLNN